ncbi:MAG: beta-L-arabinofuranosidase domain-containing protein [Chitinophagaceae bacterium]
MKKTSSFLVFSFLVLLVVTAFKRDKHIDQIQITDITRPATALYNSFYISNKAPLKPSSFIKLPIGSIQPGGWVLACLERERNGETGHLEQISAFLEHKDNAWLNPEGEGIHGWEEVPYWLRGYADLGYVLKDPTIIRKAEIWLDAVLKSQRPDGYFGPMTIEKNGTPSLWPNMIMLWCLQSYYEYSHDKRVIPFMTKYFQWELKEPDNLFLKNYWGNSRAGDNLYSVYWLYNRTGYSWLLQLATKIHDNMADWSQANSLPNWHNVNVAQGFRAPATYYLQTRDSSGLEATYHDFYLIRSIYGQVPGGMYGADENARPGHTGPHQAIETCGMVEQMASDELLLQLTGDPMWADNCENVTFNTYPAAMTPDFRALRYLTAPNMVSSDTANHSPGIENAGPFFMMNPLDHRCCQHNHSMGWPYYAEHLWMATPDNGLAAVLYSDAKVNAMAGNGTKVNIEERTHYPFGEKVEFIIHTPKANSFPLYLRIPGWCKTAFVTINGIKQKTSLSPDTYARIENTWKNGDKIVLELPMEITLTTWEKDKNSVSVNYGPLTFSLKIKERFEDMNPEKIPVEDAHYRPGINVKEWPAVAIDPESAWNYGLNLKSRNPGKDFRVIHKAWPRDNFPFTPHSVPIELVTIGKQIPSWTIDKNGLCGAVPQSPVAVNTPAKQIILIPMGASRLRISAFPVVK